RQIGFRRSPLQILPEGHRATMSIAIKMPALSPTMEEGTLAKWLVKVGDKVSSGDIMAEIETDKATMEFEAVDEGVIADIAVAEGTEGGKVGTVLGVPAEEGEDPASVKAAGGEKSAPPAAPKAAVETEKASPPQQDKPAPREAAPAPAARAERPASSGDRIVASPL